MEVSKRLKTLRLDAGYTQKEIAEKLNVLRTNYRRWENGERNPKKESLEKLASIFGVSVSYLLGETDVKDLDSFKKNESKMLFCERVKELRLEAGYTQKKLAELLNINQPRIVEWEKGKINPNKESLGKLAVVFNVAVSYLLGETDIKHFNNIEQETNEKDNIIPFPVQLFPYEAEDEVELSAGLGEGYTDTHPKRIVYWDKKVAYDRAIPIKGDSMTPDYESGEIALIREQNTLDYEGEVCAVDDVERGKTYIKCVYFEEDCLILESLNDSTDELGELLYPDIIIPLEDKPRIIGRVIEHFVPMEP